MPYPDNYRASDNPHLYSAAELAQSEREEAWFAFTDALGLLLDGTHDVPRDRIPETRESGALLAMLEKLAAEMKAVAA